MKLVFRYIVLLGVCLTFQVSLNAQQHQNIATDVYGSPVPVFTDAVIAARLMQMSSCITPRLNSIVKSYIKTYTVNKRQKAEAILGRTATYFPLFEKYLKETQLPNDLKYLSVVESALVPFAVSRSRAVGLWQFMPATGKEYGLAINRLVDERMDPHRSTQAALKYLGRLYKRFGDWSLALAAYNGGPGRVSRAIKRARSKNFWRISKYLPRETRNYVPAFIAASYLIHNYQHHNLIPQYPPLDLQLIETIKIYDRITFQRISEVTGVPMTLIEELNPSFLQKLIPSNRRGNYLTLPQNGMAVFKNFSRRPDSGTSFDLVSSPINAPSQTSNAAVNLKKTYYRVQPGDNLNYLAKLFNCTPQGIQKWNELVNTVIHPGQVLTIYQPNNAIISNLLSTSPLKKRIELSKISTPVIKDIELPKKKLEIQQLQLNLEPSGVSRKILPFQRKKYIYYQIKRGETLIDIANKFPNISLRQLMQLNKIRGDQMPKAGKRIKLKELK